MKKIFILAVAIFTVSSAFAQYSKGTFKLSLDLGNSPYISSLQTVNQTSATQTIQVSTANWASSGTNNLVNLVGLEGRYFIADRLSLKLLAGGQSSYTPARNDIPGTSSSTSGTIDPQTDVPAFSAVKEQKLHSYLAIVGVDKYFVKNNVALTVGFEGGFRYGSNSVCGITESDAGAAISEAYGFQGALTFGAEYNTDGGLFLGLEVRPASFAYTVSTLQPVAGATQQADNFNFGAFVLPMLRVGIRF